MAYNFPDSPSNGDTFTLNGVTYAYNSTKGVWKDTAVAPPSVTSSDTAPSSPAAGALWYRTDDSTLYVYYSDGSSSQWVGVSGPAGPQGTTGATGAAGVDGADGIDATSTLAELTDTDTTTTAPSTGDLLEWNGTKWVPATRSEGITHMDQWRYTNTSGTGDVNPLSTDLARVNDATFANIGTGMSVASGVWTFPVTGVWRVDVIASYNFQQGDGAAQLWTNASTDGGSTWDRVAEAMTSSINTSTTSRWLSASSTAFINVTSTTDVKINFQVNSLPTNVWLKGITDFNRNSFTFTRIGPSQ